MPKRVVLKLLHLLAHVHFHLHLSLLLFSHFHLLPISFVLHLVLSLLIEYILLIKGIDLALYAHLRILSHSLLMLHLHHPGSFHLQVPLLIVLLHHPHLVVLHVVVVHYLVSSLFLDGVLSVHVSQLSDIVGFVKLLFHEPVLHLRDARVVHQFFGFGVFQEL